MFEEIRLEGDFILSSGRKSTYFYDFDLLSPEEMADYIKSLTDSFPRDLKVDFVASPAHGGLVPGFLVAFALGKPFVTIDKEDKPRGPSFKSGRYLIVDDVISSFQAIDKVRNALGKNTCVGAAALMYRGPLSEVGNRGFPVFYLAKGEQEV